MGSILVVFRKEVVDNFRDGRTLLTALLLGPLLGPALFAFLISAVLRQSVAELDEALELPVVGAEQAPNLIQFLREQNVEILDPPADPEAAVSAGENDVVLVIPSAFADAFRAGTPAPLRLVMDRSNQSAARDVARARALLSGYSRQLALLKLQLRGVSPLALSPLMVEEADVSTPSGRSAVVLGMVPYFVLFSILMGCFNIAIDTTAGERERGSLESLLTLPVGRSQLALGKLAASCLYSIISLLLAVLAFGISISYIPLEDVGMTANFGPAVMLKVLGVALPFVLLAASLLTLIASFTRSFKEAQSYLSLVLLVPMIPFIASTLAPIQPSPHLMGLPVLSQHLLITELMKGEPVALSAILVSIAGTLAAGGLGAWATTRLYRREGLLG